MTNPDDIKKKLTTSTTLPMGTAGSIFMQKPQGHVHGPGCGCGLPLADDGDEFEDEED